MANDEINVPSLVLILVVSGLLLRHFFFRGTPSSSAGGTVNGTGTTSRAGALSPQEQRRAEELDRRTEAAVAQILQIFPHADRREVWWDLRRSNLNVAATTERILAGRLEMPPVTFQPPPPPQAGATRGANRAGGSRNGPGASGAGRSSQPNLIQRYNLEGRVATAETAELTPPPSPSAAASSSSSASNKAGKSWSSNRDERQSLLKKRRDDMILEARRKMAAKMAAEKSASSA